MADISSPETFVDGQTVTGARPNNLTAGTILQASISAKSSASPVDTDSFNFYQLGTDSIKRVTGANLKTYVGTPTSDVQTFTATGAGTWTKPTTFSPKHVRVI